MKTTVAFLCVSLLQLLNPNIGAADSTLPTRFPASDGSCSISAPEGWTTQIDKESTAQLMLQGVGEVYMNVWVEAKEDFVKMDLPTFTKKRFDEFLKRSGDPRHAPIENGTAGSLHGVQLQTFAAVNNLNIGYLYTIVEDKSHYYRILQWTLRSKFNSTLPLFKQMLSTFSGRAA